MTTLNELANDLLDLYRAEVSDDESIELANIKYWIHNQRALWLRNELNKNRSIDDNIVQDLGCVELEVVDGSACSDKLTGCSVLRTKLEIPVPIELHHRQAITRVGPLNRIQSRFSFVPYERAIWSGNGKFNRNSIFAFMLSNRIYLKSNPDNLEYKMLTDINVRGVFEDPTKVAVFTDATGNSCYSDDDRYPVNKWMIDYMTAQIIQAKLPAALQAVEDEANDADNTIMK